MADQVRKNHAQLGIGEKIRAMRQDKGVSIQQLAERAGLAKALISQIENGQVSPPIATLLKVANSLDTDISLFFQDEASSKKTVVVRSNERLVSQRRQVRGKAHLGYNYEALAYTKTSKHMEPFLVTFDPKDQEEVIQFTHEGEECAFVLEGRLEFSSREETIVLEPGDCIYFESDQLHGFRALGQEPARALVTVYHR
ncbi:MAG: cupin domain-containing protein [Desulfohalobiaceae bacterium]|nr:cupin domain-containing protein [Desulfohalobiaceae bacterium]